MPFDHRTDLDGILNRPVNRRTALRWMGASTAAVTFGTVLGACGSSGHPSSASAVDQSSATPKRGGTMTFGVLQGQEESPDPLYSGGDVAQYLASLCFDRLAALDRNQSGWVLVPRLAESWTISPDASTYTINVRKGVTFHNGQPLTAADVVFNLKRYLSNGSVVQGDLAPYYKESGVTQVGEYTAQIKLIKPSALLMYVFREFQCGLYPAGTTDFTKCMGTGPFVLDNYSGTEGASVTRNPSYWEPGLPYLDTFRITVLPEVDSAVQAIEAGEVDAVAPNELPQVNITQLSTASGVKILRLHDYWFDDIQANPFMKPFDDVRVREALALSVNPQLVSQQLFQGYAVDSANIPVAPDDPFFPPSLKGFKPDLAKAKALLAAAGYPDGLQVPLVVSSNQSFLGSMLLFANQAAEAGIHFQISEKPDSVYYSSTSGWGTGHAWQDGWWLKHPIIMSLYLYQDTPSYREWTPAWASAAIEKAMSTPDQATQIATIRPVFEAASTQAGLVAPVIRDGFIPVRSNVTGLDQNTFNLDGYFQQVGFA